LLGREPPRSEKEAAGDVPADFLGLGETPSKDEVTVPGLPEGIFEDPPPGPRWPPAKYRWKLSTSSRKKKSQSLLLMCSIMMRCQKLFSARNQSVSFTARVDALAEFPWAIRVF
jgi:hypothetical protein